MQNEIISLIGGKILSVISSEIKAAPGFAVIADETSDLSGQSSLELLIDLIGDTLVAVSNRDFVSKVFLT